MPLLQDPSVKYKKFPPVNLPNRQWPSKTIDKAPRWLATDLRDGNQSLPDPMNFEEKKEYFHKLVEIGYKEIEVAFPSASQIDFDFTRYAVENAPEDVWIQVLAPCREQLIRRTVESLKGAKKAIVHIYLASSQLFRDVVFGMTEDQGIELAVKCTKLVRSLTKDDPSTAGTEWALEFSPETFSDTPLDYSLRLCEAVKKAWQPSVENKIIFNLPATVEMATPNIYADQIEYFATHISEREKICISLHPHNDRGCAVAAAELAQMGGADRVEGCLFGNGERTGNVDLVTLGLNLYTQGISPNIDFSDITSIVEVVERCNKIPVHPRAPYGGSLVVCAFSGSHQDAIKKGFARYENNKAQNPCSCWQIPYLPLDPKDIGRTYEAVIRVNSQSGKGGAAWIILKSLELDLPRGLQVAFSSIVQREAEFKGRELKSAELTELFENEYHLTESSSNYKLISYDIAQSSTVKESRDATAVIEVKGTEHNLAGTGNGPISSFLDALDKALGIQFDVQTYHEHSIGKGSKTKAATYIQMQVQGSNVVEWGVGIHEDVAQASILAILSCLQRVKEKL
ncbi:2-isopropylmalate synthase 2, mitochondrial [Trichomonascus vanleenenianus]|uniref:2-isopropylmalate synthase LEU4 n=1 Tax=Trichomonascus vanleenenianus TaxID=2268995 RepID=UPI003ECB428A